MSFNYVLELYVNNQVYMLVYDTNLQIPVWRNSGDLSSGYLLTKEEVDRYIANPHIAFVMPSNAISTSPRDVFPSYEDDYELRLLRGEYSNGHRSFIMMKSITKKTVVFNNSSSGVEDNAPVADDYDTDEEDFDTIRDSLKKKVDIDLANLRELKNAMNAIPYKIDTSLNFPEMNDKPLMVTWRGWKDGRAYVSLVGSKDEIVIHHYAGYMNPGNDLPHIYHPVTGVKTYIDWA